MVLAMAARHEHLVTVEDACVMGGAGSAVAEALQKANVLRSILSLGLPDEFVEHGDPAKLMALLGLDAAGIEKSIRQKWPEQAA
jgi:1-deoxy-D-xylulose-5-phosphate synthase